MAAKPKKPKPFDPFPDLCVLHGLPRPETEYHFDLAPAGDEALYRKDGKPREWRFDYSWPDYWIAIEKDGGIWVQGRHSRGAGIRGDNEKLNTAVLMGWRVLRFEPSALKKGEPISWVKAIIEHGAGGAGKVGVGGVSASKELEEVSALQSGPTSLDQGVHRTASRLRPPAVK